MGNKLRTRSDKVAGLLLQGLGKSALRRDIQRMADMLAKIRRRLAPGGDATGAIPAPAAETPLLDPEVKGVDARRLADLKAEEAGRRWRKAAEARGEIPVEVGGPQGLEPTRYGAWEKAGSCYDF